MASIFPPVIEYTQDFVPNDTKMPQLERTISGQTIKSYIPQFSGDSIEMLLYMVSKFLNAMQTQTINANLWQDQFGYAIPYMETRPTYGTRCYRTETITMIHLIETK